MHSCVGQVLEHDTEGRGGVGEEQVGAGRDQAECGQVSSYLYLD